jgi:hypothetical protein
MKIIIIIIIIDFYNKKIQDVPIISCFSCDSKLCFVKQLKCFLNKSSKKKFIISNLNKI